jgi:hypothetical protein
MNVEIGAEAVLFPEKEYINGIAVAVYVAGRWGQIKSESVLGCIEKPRNDKNLFHSHKRKKPTKKKSPHLPSFNSQLGSPLSGFSGGHDLYSFHHNTNSTLLPGLSPN